MLFRSKRSELQSNATAAEVGPGAYEVSSSMLKPQKFAVAPFGSTANRSSVALLDPNPGPGAYFSDAIKGNMVSRQTSQFASRVDRIPLNRSEIEGRDLPGPGTYSGAVVQPPRKPVGRPSSSKAHHAAEGINWIKVATAPSIPAVSQSHGYEEGPDGALVQQRNPIMGHSGVGHDTLGPGEYNPSLRAVKPIRGGPNFGASAAGRHDPVPKDALSRPGPGTYEVAAAGTAPVFHGGVIAERQTSSFASSTKRSTLPTKEVGPGPGAYRAPTTFIPLREHLAAHPESFQAFGRTADDGVALKKEPAAIPGPGSYDPAPEITAFSSTKKKGLSSFVSAAPRFAGHDGNGEAPGPGSYDQVAQSLTTKLSHKVNGRFGAFGSTASRFSPTADKALAEGAAPGTYNPPVKLPNPAESRRKDARSSVFRSSSKRTDMAASKHPTAPAFYTPGNEWPKPTTRSAAFFSNQPRFADAHVEELPGPGQYQYKGAIDTQRGSSVVQFKAPRFTSTKSDSNPGPGTYNTVPSMIRRTFNISIGS